MVLAAATGAVIGGVVVVALSWTLRVIGQNAGTRDAAGRELVAAGGSAGSASTPPRRVLRLHWLAKVALIALSILAYGYLGYSNQPPAPTATAQPPGPDQATAAPPVMQAQFEIGGITLTFDPPAGYCLYPSDMMQAVIAQQAKLNPDNVVHTVFGNCEQLHDAASNPARIRDFGMVMTPKAQLQQRVDKAELDKIVASVVDPATLKETLDQRMRDAQSRLKIQSFSTLGIVDREKDAAYFAYLFKSNAGDSDFAQACVMALTSVKGRLVSYYLYSDYTKDARSAVTGLVQRVKAGLGELAARNS